MYWTTTDSTAEGNTRVCFRTVSLPTYANGDDNRCFNMDLRKIEIHTKPDCWGSVRNITVGGTRVIAPSYSRYGNNVVFKITNIGGPAGSVAAGTDICIFLDGKGKCPTVDDFCAGGALNCPTAFFNQDQSCCPIWNLAENRLAPRGGRGLRSQLQHAGATIRHLTDAFLSSAAEHLAEMDA